MQNHIFPYKSLIYNSRIFLPAVLFKAWLTGVQYIKKNAKARSSLRI